MTWWRRDPTLVPFQRYAQRILRSDDAALRTRCFSRTPSKSAQHEDNNGNKRPSSMSNLEWLQLEQYQQWRKKLMNDPYEAIFGASNDRLSGKGQRDWEWLANSVPKWMLREMESHDGDASPSKQDKSGSSDPNYPRRVNIDSEERDTRREREPHFPQPSFRARLLPDDPTGIESPSDPRRPREQSHVKVVGRHSEVLTEPAPSAPSSTASVSVPRKYEHEQPTRPKSTESFGEYIAKTRTDAAKKIEQSSMAAPSTETSFMDRFLTEKPEHKDAQTKSTTEAGSWRETTLQRRTPKEVIAKPDIDPVPMTKADDESPASASSTEATHKLSSATHLQETLPSLPPSSGLLPTNQSSTQEHLPPQETPTLQGSATSARSTSEILSQLPKDDLDFLSADDIRANMAAKRSKVLNEERRKAERARLESTFESTLKANTGIDPMLESKIINDQYVRRIERQMQRPESSLDSQEPSEPKTTKNTDEPPYKADESQLESSVERMKSWLEESGARFSSLFWQDPTEEADAKKTRLFFDKILARIRKGRMTMKQVIEDLEADIPASKPLLRRMKADEDLLDSAINTLRQRSGTGKLRSLTPKKVRAIQELRLRYQSTDNDLSKAYALLQDLGDSDAAKNVSPAFKRRLSVASKITQKNAHLTRYLIWSLQARLEDPEIDQSMLANYKAVANSLLTLRDTQMALARLLERAMLVYSVAPHLWEDIKIFTDSPTLELPQDHEQSSRTNMSSAMSDADKAQLRSKVAAEERLAHEVDAQKSAMRGLSDDGYARVPKATPNRPFEERGPLAHSLFRPFGPVLESLESETPSKIGTTEADVKVTHERDDDQLADNMQMTNEDTSGPVAFDHEQQASPVGKSKLTEDHDVKKLDMLKDDPTLGDTSYQASGSTAADIVCGEEVTAIDAAPETTQDTIAAVHTTSSTEHATSDPKPSTDDTVGEIAQSGASSCLTETGSPTIYTILLHDPHTGKLSLTTSTTTEPHKAPTLIPLHEALSTLEEPAKFIPYIENGPGIVKANKYLLVLRGGLNSTAPTKPFQTADLSIATEHKKDAGLTGERTYINPIDGTARLSPTGYVGPEESEEQLEKDFTERRQAAERAVSNQESNIEQDQSERKIKEKKKGRKAAGIVKTAIWASALCYVAGVIGELAS
ncbi:hypothetical protein BKA58DRAFT_146986 [Alternaria rosae]|uniref:uncharacterized protein n=1 Tax=Alternaria rosae TaxID=1187941 RepID=UPI001E8D8534|nr:uncharacterized protein BKA58DRAFT_146986 [Alternaria rosae]KAH6872485.1 hypothetical protein BKA58DRAFT_146986 [Alternaria rosae]